MLTVESFKRCLVDEKKAAALDSCLDSLDSSENANYQLQNRLARISREKLEMEKINFQQTQQIERYQKEMKRPGFWWGVATGAIGTALIFLGTGAVIFSLK